MKEDQPSRNNVIKKKYRYSIRYENSADGCTIMPRPRMEEFASSMGQISRNTPVMDAHTMPMLRKEEFASGELQSSSSSDAAVKVVLNFLRMKECV